MTWYAHHIFIEPTDRLMTEVKNHPVLADALYWVRELQTHQWYSTHVQHALPPNGLLVIRPIGPPEDQARAPIISWHAICGPPDVEIRLQPDSLLTDDGALPYPPLSFLKYLKYLSIMAHTTVAYYYCVMWGGVPELEYGWVFTPEEVVYCGIGMERGISRICTYREEQESQQMQGDVLVAVLHHFGLDLPTPYFAPHTRGFPWEQFKIG